MIKFIGFFVFLLNAGGYAQNIKPDVVISTNSSLSKEVYKPYVKRNPMVQSSIKASTMAEYEIKFSTFQRQSGSIIESFLLIGIVKSNGLKEAILKDTLTDEIYILKNKKICNLAKKCLKDLTGEVSGNSVYLRDNTQKEVVLTLDKKE